MKCLKFPTLLGDNTILRMSEEDSAQALKLGGHFVSKSLWKSTGKKYGHYDHSGRLIIREPK